MSHKVNQYRCNGRLLIEGGQLTTIKGHRFCESCRTYQPKNKLPANKGWKCTTCLTVKK